MIVLGKGGSGGSSGGSEFEADYFDYTQSDYDYIGGINGDGNFQINRYSETEPYTRTKAIGVWADRYSLTYT